MMFQWLHVIIIKFITFTLDNDDVQSSKRYVFITDILSPACKCGHFIIYCSHFFLPWTEAGFAVFLGPIHAKLTKFFSLYQNSW